MNDESMIILLYSAVSYRIYVINNYVDNLGAGQEIRVATSPIGTYCKPPVCAGESV